MRILLVDDHFCVREGTSQVFRSEFNGIDLLEAASIEEALEVLCGIPVDLVLLDVALPGDVGLSGLRRIRQAFPSQTVVMFSASYGKEVVIESLTLGAAGFIPKSLSRAEFVDAIKAVLAGRTYLPAFALEHSDSSEFDGSACPAPFSQLGLTKREFEVLGWVAHGKCNKEIAARLGVASQTVKNHLRNIFLRLGVRSRVELLILVFKQGVTFGPPGV